MRRERNTQQIKEQGKNPSDQTKKMLKKKKKKDLDQVAVNVFPAYSPGQLSLVTVTVTVMVHVN